MSESNYNQQEKQFTIKLREE